MALDFQFYYLSPLALLTSGTTQSSGADDWSVNRVWATTGFWGLERRTLAVETIENAKETTWTT